MRFISSRSSLKNSLHKVSAPLTLNWEALKFNSNRVYSATNRSAAPESDLSSDKAKAVEEDEAYKDLPLGKCSGCGTDLQTSDSKKIGFVPQQLLNLPEEQAPLKESDNQKSRILLQDDDLNDPDDDDDDDDGGESYLIEDDEWKDGLKARKPLVCQRCFHLINYNKALHATVTEEEYWKHLRPLRASWKKALILLVVDVVDFPTNLLPNLDQMLPPGFPVVIVANKKDLLPDQDEKVLKRFRRHIIDVATQKSLSGCDVRGLHFVSAKTGEGIDSLSRNVINLWEKKGDIYLLGCTNVGKSTLFNQLLQSLCGCRPGVLNTSGTACSPLPTISRLPGTTLGLLSFPLLSSGKRRRLVTQQKKSFFSRDDEDFGAESDYMEDDFFREESVDDELDEILTSIGYSTGRPKEDSKGYSPPLNRFWLHDTPGAVNGNQIPNLLTMNELKCVLPSKTFKSNKTFILKPKQTLFLAGLARLDYLNGPSSVYFTVYSSHTLPLHTTKTENARSLYEQHAGRTNLLKVCQHCKCT